MRIPRMLGIPAIIAAALAAVVLVTSATAASRAVLVGSVPPWATHAALSSAASTGDGVGFRVYLGWRGGDAAKNLATAVTTPGSAQFGHFLTAQQFRAQFSPSLSDVNAVRGWLRGQGFTIDYVPQNNHYVAAEGTVGQAAAAFGTTFGEYAVQGLTLRAPEKSLSVPSALGKIIQSVVGLDETAALVHTDDIVADAPPSAGFRNAPPCSAYWAEKIDTAQPGNYPYAPCGYNPSQLRGAYGTAGAIASGNDGTGTTVAVIDAYASPTIQSDVNTYSSRHGLPQLTSSTFHQIVPPGIYHVKDNPGQSPTGWYGEETLDIEAVHSMAPGASIVYVGAPNNYQDLDAALNHVVDNHLADIVTNSYGWSGEQLPPGFVKPVEDTLIQGAAEGIGIYFSSGDNGDETGGSGDPSVASPDFPASSPFVTAVGGTSLAVGAANDYLFETGWETGRAFLASDNTWNQPTFLYGSGGGTSRLFAQPAYQAGVVPNALATAFGARAQPMRVVPDISMVGDPNTGMLVGQTQTFSDGVYYDEYRIGGTSLSSPLMAGIVALAEQRAGHPLGLINPVLYAMSPSSIHDATQPATTQAVARVDYINSENAAGGLRTTLRYLSFDQSLTIHAAPGYDNVTGRGTPTGEAFLTALAG